MPNPTAMRLDLEALLTIDEGRVRETFQQALHRLETDCRDRPGLKDARKLRLNVELRPIPDDSGDLGEVDVKFFIEESLPKRKTRAYTMRAERDGLFYQPYSPHDPNQTSLEALNDAG